MRKISILSVAVFALLASATASFADVAVDQLERGESGQFGLSVGAEYSSGDYGSYADTEIWYFPLTARYETDRWQFKFTVPYLVVSGPGDVLIIGGGGMGSHSTTGGMGGMGGTVSTLDSRTESGIGDLIATVGYTLLTGDRDRPEIYLTGKIYFGTADDTRGLGTGENSYAAQLGFDQDIGVATLFGSAGYLVTGDPPGIEYDDVFYGVIGLERNLGRSAIGGSFHAQQAVLAGADDYVDLTGYFRLRTSENRRLSTYLSLGLSDTAPDFGAGVTVTWYF